MNPTNPLKLTLGIRPENKMFRLASIAGLLAEDILAIRGRKGFPDDYFEDIFVNNNDGILRLKDRANTNLVHIDNSTFVFNKNWYKSETGSSQEVFFKEFEAIWRCANEKLKMTGIRRIGLVAEFRFKMESGDPSSHLIKKLTTLPKGTVPAKFTLQYEDRSFTPEGLAPDVKKSDFFNTIYSLYDSSLDADVPEEGAINANIDIQKYFAPLLDGNVTTEVEKLARRFSSGKELFLKNLKELGLY